MWILIYRHFHLIRSREQTKQGKKMQFSSEDFDS